jgi:hypothetical protein
LFVTKRFPQMLCFSKGQENRSHESQRDDNNNYDDDDTQHKFCIVSR